MDLSKRVKLFQLLTSQWSTISGLSKKSIGYIGWVGHNNLGDEAMFYSFKKLFPNHGIFPYNTINEYPRLENKLRPKNFQAIILGGGTLINSAGSLKNFKNIFNLYPNSLKCTFGTGVKNPLFWNNIENWQDNLTTWIKYLKQCEYVSVRGPLSNNLLKDNGFTKAEIIGDIALSLANDKIINKQKNKLLAINVGSGSGRIWGDEEKLLEDMKKLINQLIKNDWKITLFPVWDNDKDYINKIKNKVDKTVKVFSRYKSIKKTLQFLAKCDLVIGEKLHSVVLAHCVHTPAIMLEYRPKCLDYMLSMGMEKFLVRTDGIDNKKILYLLDELYGNSGNIQSLLKKKIDYYKNLQLKAAKNINKLLK